MLKIDKDSIWVMWPDFLVDNFIDYPSNKIFGHDGNFNFTIEFEILKEVVEKMTLFAKLPSYFGIDIEENGLLLILNEDSTETKYLNKDYDWGVGKRYKLIVGKFENTIKIILNDELILTHILNRNLVLDVSPHIIFGSGNFPKNGFNLNYFYGNIHYLSIEKDGEILSEHTFDKFIHNKSYDLTGNCNFIHKI